MSLFLLLQFHIFTFALLVIHIFLPYNFQFETLSIFGRLTFQKMILRSRYVAFPESVVHGTLQH